MGMMNLLVAIYVTVFAAIQVLTRLAVRNEPTAHGQIVARQLAFVFGLIWPLTAVWMLAVALWHGGAWLFGKLKEPKQ